jgi:hypothetical protein
VLVLLLVLDRFSFDHEREHEHDYERKRFFAMEACMCATLIDYALCGGRRFE